MSSNQIAPRFAASSNKSALYLDSLQLELGGRYTLRLFVTEVSACCSRRQFVLVLNVSYFLVQARRRLLCSRGRKMRSYCFIDWVRSLAVIFLSLDFHIDGNFRSAAKTALLVMYLYYSAWYDYLRQQAIKLMLCGCICGKLVINPALHEELVVSRINECQCLSPKGVIPITQIQFFHSSTFIARCISLHLH